MSTETSNAVYIKETKKPNRIVSTIIITVIAFIILLGFGKGIGITIKKAARRILAKRKILLEVRKLMDNTKIVAAEAGSPKNTCLFFNG